MSKTLSKLRELHERTVADFVCAVCGKTKEWCERVDRDKDVCEFCFDDYDEEE